MSGMTLITEPNTYESLLPRSAVHNELGRVIDALRDGRTELIDAWPFPPGPRGPLLLADGSVPHGAYVVDAGRTLLLVVANSGWPIEVVRVPGPNPGRLAALDPCSCWIAQHPTLIGDGPALRVLDPGDGALERVAAGAKVLGMADTVHEAQARAWVSAAKGYGLASTLQHDRLSCCDQPEEFWIVTFARREPVPHLIDLDYVGLYYDEALGGDAARSGRITRSLGVLAGSAPVDFLDVADQLASAPQCDLEPGDVTTEMAGILFGYWPPTTAAVLQAIDGRQYREPQAVVDLTWWDSVRFDLGDVA